MIRVSKSLLDKQNAFYALFDVKNTKDLVQATVCCDASGDTHFCVSEVDVSKICRTGISNRVLKSCAAQLGKTSIPEEYL